MAGAVRTGAGCAEAARMRGGKGPRVEIQVNADGTIEVRVGTQDPGTGSRPVVQVVAAEMLGLESVTGRIGDSRLPPSDSNGGRQTKAAVSPAIFDAGEDVVDELKTPSGIYDPPEKREGGVGEDRPWVAAGARQMANGLSTDDAGGDAREVHALTLAVVEGAPARGCRAPARGRPTGSACERTADGSVGIRGSVGTTLWLRRWAGLRRGGRRCGRAACSGA